MKDVHKCWQKITPPFAQFCLHWVLTHTSLWTSAMKVRMQFVLAIY